MFNKIKKLLFIEKYMETLRNTLIDNIDAVNNLNHKYNNLNSHLGEIHNSILDITKLIQNNMNNNSAFNITINKNAEDFGQMQENFKNEMMYRIKSSYGKIKSEDQLQDFFIKYDKLIYYIKSYIPYTELVYKLMELEYLKKEILRTFIGLDEVFSFYLYVIDNSNFKYTISDISRIDKNKIFLLDENNIDKVTGQNYILLNMKNNNIEFMSPTGIWNIDNRYRKTVIRVLYSIWMDKYYLYHLNEN